MKSRTCWGSLSMARGRRICGSIWRSRTEYAPTRHALFLQHRPGAVGSTPILMAQGGQLSHCCSLSSCDVQVGHDYGTIYLTCCTALGRFLP